MRTGRHGAPTVTWIVRLRQHDGRIVETASYGSPIAAMDAYRLLLSREDLVGEPLAAVFKPPRGAVTDGNSSTWFSRFDRGIGDGRTSPDDPRLDPFARLERVHEVLHSRPPEVVPIDWEADARPFPEALKAWHADRGLTRDQASAELRVPRSTYDGWCAGRPCDREATIRRLMTLTQRG